MRPMKRMMVLSALSLALALFLALGGLAAAQQQTVTVQLSPQGGSGVSGTATLTATGPSTTTVTLQVSGLPPNTAIANHFHTGTCDNPGPITNPLNDLQADAQGNATATTTLNVPLSSLADGNHIVQTHMPPGIGAPSACGSVPAVAAAPAATPTPAPAVTPTPAPAVAARAGGVAPLVAAGALVALGLSALGGGLALRRRS